MDKLEEIIAGLEVNWSAESEILSSKIGEDILAALKTEDPVAYIRFASVYMNFNSREDFQDLMPKAKK